MMQQRTDDWFQQRIGRFTASEIHKLICKKGALTQTARTYIVEKVTETIIGQNNDSFETMAMVWGTDHEPEALELYELVTGNDVELSGFHQYGDHAGGSPDGLIGDDGMIEIKCPYSSKNHIEYGLIESAKDLPPAYFWQMQMNMMITGREWCDFVSYDPRCKYHIFIYRVDADEKAFEMLKNAIEKAVEQKALFIEKIESRAK